MYYVALIHKEKTSDYGVSFPDFPGCVSAGKTLEEAQIRAQEAIDNHRKMLKEMGAGPPHENLLTTLARHRHREDP